MVIFDLDMTLVDTSIAEQLRETRQWQRVYELIPKMTLFPEMKQLSDLFHSYDIKIAVVTNSPREYAVRVLNYFEFHYDTLVAYHDVKRRKPDTQPYEIAIQQVEPQYVKKILIFGDKLDDMVPAKKMALVSCACIWSAEIATKDEFRKLELDYYFETPLDALNCFASILNKYK